MKNTKVVTLVFLQIVILYQSINFCQNKKIYSLELFNHQLKLSDVRKAETIKFQESFGVKQFGELFCQSPKIEKRRGSKLFGKQLTSVLT